MLAQGSWYLSTANRERRRLFPRGIVALFALAMVVVGFLALPSKDLHSRLANAQKSDLLTVSYLHAWLNAVPRDWRLRLTLARHQVLAGQDRSALQSIEYLLADGPSEHHESALRLRLNVLERMLHALTPGHPRYVALRAAVRDALSAVAERSQDPIELQAYLERARYLNFTDIAARCLARLPDLLLAQTGTSAAELMRATRRIAGQAIGLGDFVLAAQLYWWAFDQSRSNNKKVDLLILVARAEQSGNRLKQFFVALEPRLKTVKLDSPTYKILARLALSANRLDLADKFARRMLQFSHSGSWHLKQDVDRWLVKTWAWLKHLGDAVSPISSAHATMQLHQRSVAISPPNRPAPFDSPADSSGQAVTNSNGKPSIQDLPEAAKNSASDPLSEIIRLALIRHTGTAIVRQSARRPDPLAGLIRESLQRHADVQAVVSDHHRWGHPPASSQVVQHLEPIGTADTVAQNQRHLDDGIAADLLPDPESTPGIDLSNATHASAVALSVESLQAPATVPLELSADLLTSESIFPDRRAPIKSENSDQLPHDEHRAADGKNDDTWLKSLITAVDKPFTVAAPNPAHKIPPSHFDSGKATAMADARREFGIVPNRNGALSHDANRQTDALIARRHSGPENFNSLFGSIAPFSAKFNRKRPYYTANSSATVDLARGPNLAFNHSVYLLAYQVFLAQGKLDDAFTVAHSASRQSGRRDWRQRLAKVAEWSQRPVIALAHWRILARESADASIWNNVHRLAVGLRDEQALIEVLEWRLTRNANDPDIALKIAAAWERIGDPQQAITWLGQQINGAPPGTDYRLRAELAHIANRVGDSDLLILTLQEMNRHYGPSPARASRIANALFSRGQLQAALNHLIEAESQAENRLTFTEQSERETGYWSLYGELARQLGRNTTAIKAYRHSIALNSYQAGDLQTLISLLESRSLKAAAQVAAHAYDRFQLNRFATAAANLWLRDGQLKTSQQFVARLPSSLRRKISNSLTYLRERASLHQAQGRFNEATKDYLTIYRHHPHDMSNRAALIWVLLAARKSSKLHHVLRKWATTARNQSALWGPFGAALLALGEPERALKYFVWQARKKQDYLWWLAYADALDAAGRVDAAWQLRRRAWTKLRRENLTDKPENRLKYQRIVALAMQFGPAGQARDMLANLVRKHQPVRRLKGKSTPSSIKPSHKTVSSQRLATILFSWSQESNQFGIVPNLLDSQAVQTQTTAMHRSTNELALSYLLSSESLDSARAWLLSRYAKDLVQPAWAELSIALAEQDNVQVEKLLETVSDWLPKLDRVEAMRRLGRVGSAQSSAFNTFSNRPNSDNAHQKLVDTVLTSSPSSSLTATRSSQGVVDSDRLRLDTKITINQRLSAVISAQTATSQSVDPQVLAGAAIKRRELGVAVRLSRSAGDWTARINRRNSLVSNTGAALDWTSRFSPILQLSAGIGLNQETNDTPALAMAGQADQFHLQALVNLTGRDRITTRIKHSSLETLAGTRVGSADLFSLEYAHRLRIDYPGLTLLSRFSRSKYGTNNALDPIITRLTPSGSSDAGSLFVPSSSNQLDVVLSFGQSIANSYTRALRFFGELGLHRNSKSKTGFSAQFGVSRSVFGADRLSLIAGITSKSPGARHGSHAFGLNYRIYH